MLANLFGALSLTLGIYLMYYIRLYLRSKPPGFKTILDELYIQLHEYWIVEGMIFYGAVTIYELQETSWILSWIFGFGYYLLFLLASFHLLVCLIFRIFLIFSHSTFEEIEDKYILGTIR